MKLDLARRGEDCGFDRLGFVPPARIERLRSLLDVGFGTPGDEEARPVHAIGGGSRAEQTFTERVQHRLELAWRARQEYDHAIALFDVLPWRRPVRVGEHDRSL